MLVIMLTSLCGQSILYESWRLFVENQSYNFVIELFEVICQFGCGSIATYFVFFSCVMYLHSLLT